MQNNDQTTLIDTFAALGDPTRFAIVERLLRDGPTSAGALQDVADISAPAISRHLKVLREAGLIEQQIDKQRRIYSVSPHAIGRLSAWTLQHEDFWRTSLDRLSAALSQGE